MSTYQAAREAVVALFHPAWGTQYPTIPLIFENTNPVNLDKVGDAIAYLHIDFDDAQQMTVNNDPHYMIYGTVRITLLRREGKGTLDLLKQLDFITNLAKFKLNTSITFWLPTPGRKASQKGWYSQEIEVPFRFHTMGV